MSIVDIARQLVAPGKGILAADESTATIAKRFEKAKIENAVEHRQLYRELLFTTPTVEKYISGVILFEETLKQSSRAGVPFSKILSDRGIMPGIKVDQGVEEFGVGEKRTKGLEGLAERLQDYQTFGARFTKWRAVITIGENIPTDNCLRENAQSLAQYARVVQDAGLVPIVEPEVLMDGPHTMERCNEVTEKTLQFVFDELRSAKVDLRGMLLKPNMVIAGTEATHQSSREEVARMTISCFEKVVPVDVPGIVFLSGGQSDLQAVENLNEMNKRKDLPWQLSFSYGRGLQQGALQALTGKIDDESAQQEAQRAFAHSAEQCGLARSGSL